jgi:heme exporter protein C
MNTGFHKEHIIGALGLAMLSYGSWMGLFVLPPMSHFQEVGRIFFIHVPTAWNSLLVLTGSFILAIGVLLNRRAGWDAALTASVEVGVLYTAMLLVQGSIWARPTFNTWWTWDPRLLTAAILLVAFAGVLSLRSFAEGRDRRMVWTAAATIVAYVDVPIVYFIVKWLPRGIHQPHSFPSTVSSDYHTALRINAFAMLFIAIWFVARRTRMILLQDAGTAMSAPAPADSGRDGKPMVAGVEV